MDEKDLRFLAKRGLSLLRLDSDDWEAVEDTRHLGTRFSLTFPHELARNGISQSIALISVSGRIPSLRIGFIRSIQAISTFDSRVLFDFVHPILPETLDGLLAQVTERSLRSGAAKLGTDETRLRSVSAKLGARMIEVIAALPDNVPAVQRILSSARRPFYFKLVKRRAATNTAGILLSLDHLKQMISEGKATGPRGGLRISYQALNGHYLRSDPFVDLVRSGYIGTRGATTEHLQSLIDATLTGGRAVVAAIQSAIAHESRPAGGQARF